MARYSDGKTPNVIPFKNFRRPESYDKQASIKEVLNELLQSSSETIRSKSLCIELDCDETDACTAEVQATLERLLSLAMDRSPSRGEVIVTVVDTSSGLEIEVADSGNAPLQAMPLGNFRGVDASAVFSDRDTSTNTKLYCQRCPQGGVAWTLVLDQPSAALRAA